MRVQEFDGLGAAAAETAVHVDDAIIGDLVEALRELSERDQHRSRDALLVPLPCLANIDQHRAALGDSVVRLLRSRLLLAGHGGEYRDRSFAAIPRLVVSAG